MSKGELARVISAKPEIVQVVQWHWPIGPPLVGGFGNGLCQTRTTVNTNIYRVLQHGSVMVLGALPFRARTAARMLTASLVSMTSPRHPPCPRAQRGRLPQSSWISP